MIRKENCMNHKCKFILRLFIVLFTVSVSTTVIPGEIINTYGIFGEVKTLTATNRNRKDAALIASSIKKADAIKGINKYNIWLEFVIIIICMIYASYVIKRPGKYTIVDLKVRMDD